MATGLAKVMSPRSRVKRMPWEAACPSMTTTPAQAEVGVAGEASDCRAHLELRRSHDMDIEFYVVERRVGGGNSGELAAAFEISAEGGARRHGHFVGAGI